MTPEQAIKKRVRLAVARDERVRLFPNVVGLMYPYELVKQAIARGDVESLQKRAPMQVGLGKGSADLIGIVVGSGRFVGLEIKTSHAASKVRLEQELWLAKVREWGAFAAVVTSPEEALAAVTRACAGESQ